MVNQSIVKTFCTYYHAKECQSCEWIELEYTQQISKKETKLVSTLGLSSNFVLEKSVSSSPTGFRNRAKMIVTGTSEKPIIGLTGETNLDEGRELLQCPIHHPKLNELIQALPKWIQQYNLIPYHIESRKGELKGLILFYSPTSQQMYLRFVLRSKECISRIQKLLPALQKDFPNLKCVSANIQPIPHAILEGKDEIFITDQKYIDHQLGHLTLQLAPQAFVQTNTEVATQLYQTAAHWIAEIKPKKMLELFCGQGAFSFFAAQSADVIEGIEINEDAVNTANKTAQTLGLNHLQFRCMDAGNATGLNADLVLVNPPRRGLSQSMHILKKIEPPYLIYSSCSVDTLAIDIQNLSVNYEIKKVQLFDLFPHTEHFETLVLLVKKTGET